MTWHQRYLIRNYLTNSLWIWPVLGLVVALVAARCVDVFEQREQLGPAVDPEAARSVLNTLASAMFTCIIFAASALLLAMQLATAQLTPRIMALVFRDPVTKLSLTVFAFAFAFSLSALVRIGSVVPMLTARLAGYGCLVSLALFLMLIDHVGRFLRPSGALRAVAHLGHHVIQRVFPRQLGEPPAGASPPDASPEGPPAFTVASQSNGVILALDVQGVLAIAEHFNCLLIMVPQVGDFVTVGDPLFHVFHGGEGLPAGTLGRSIAVGQERTLEQDPTLALRIIVDVASKALSAAINDPTTAVLAIDQIHHLLSDVGTRCLDEGHVRDAAGRLRLVYRTPDWGDFVRLAVTEIRQYGAQSIQVLRRLRAMLENLLQTLPAERSTLLREELLLLHRTANRSFPEPEDQVFADSGDSQGVGGTHAEDMTASANGGQPPTEAKG